MRTNDLARPVLSALLVLVPAACSTNDGDLAPDTGQPGDGRAEAAEGDDGGLDTTAESDAREALGCDAYYAPEVHVTFTIAATELPYCGPAEVSYEVVGSGETGTSTCDCVEDIMTVVAGWAMGIHKPCHINPPEGETSLIHVAVAGYAPFETTVELPYRCHPETTVVVRLVPAER